MVLAGGVLFPEFAVPDPGGFVLGEMETDVVGDASEGEGRTVFGGVDLGAAVDGVADFAVLGGEGDAWGVLAFFGAGESRFCGLPLRGFGVLIFDDGPAFLVGCVTAVVGGFVDGGAGFAGEGLGPAFGGGLFEAADPFFVALGEGELVHGGSVRVVVQFVGLGKAARLRERYD